MHQATVGLRWIHPRLVLEGGIVRDISNGDEARGLLGTRLHFQYDYLHLVKPGFCQFQTATAAFDDTGQKAG